jgi:hypothetical protein
MGTQRDQEAEPHCLVARNTHTECPIERAPTSCVNVHTVHTDNFAITTLDLTLQHPSMANLH